MFELHEQPVLITNHNARKERHGTERKLAGDLSLQAICPASILDAFDPKLRDTLVRERGNDEPESKKELIESEHANDKLTRRLPQLEPLVWNEEFPGYALAVVKGLNLEAPIELDGRKLHKFRFEILDQGLVKLNCQCSGLYDDYDISGRFDDLIQTEVLLTLTAPIVSVATPDPAQQQLPDTARRNVLVTALEVTQSGATHLFRAKVTLSDSDVETVGDWAYRPSIDEIAMKLSDELDASIEFTPVARSEYEEGHAEA